MNKKEHFIASDDGVKTFVLELIPDVEILGPPVFCIHGLTRNHKDFSPIFDDLLAMGRKIYAIDVRGRGRSDYDSKPENYHPGTYVGDVANILAQLNIENAVFIGTSMGGIISIILAAFMPNKVAGLILNDVGPEVNEDGIKRIRNYVGDTSPANSWDEAIGRVKNIALSAYPDRENDSVFWHEFAKRVQKETNEGIVFDYDANIKFNVLAAPQDGTPIPTLWPQFDLIANIPIAVVRGELSDILTTDLVEKMKSAKPDLEIAEIANVGHAPILDEAAAINLIKKVIAQTAQ